MRPRAHLRHGDRETISPDPGRKAIRVAIELQPCHLDGAAPMACWGAAWKRVPCSPLDEEGKGGLGGGLLDAGHPPPHQPAGSTGPCCRRPPSTRAVGRRRRACACGRPSRAAGPAWRAPELPSARTGSARPRPHRRPRPARGRPRRAARSCWPCPGRGDGRPRSKPGRAGLRSRARPLPGRPPRSVRGPAPGQRAYWAGVVSSGQGPAGIARAQRQQRGRPAVEISVMAAPRRPRSPQPLARRSRGA